jgi:AcrR family transcriptional regulator
MAPTARADPAGLSRTSTDRSADNDNGPPAITDGRQLRRERNREAVVEALLDLYRDGNLRPSSEEIAARSGLSPRSLFRYFDDVDDLIRAAIRSQEARALPMVPIAVEPDAPLGTRVAALVEQRFRLFDAIGHAAAVLRLRSPFQPLLAAELTQNRKFLRSQVRQLFAPELSRMDAARVASLLAAADVLTSFESHQHLVEHRAMSSTQAKAVMVDALTLILGPAR